MTQEIQRIEIRGPGFEGMSPGQAETLRQALGRVASPYAVEPVIIVKPENDALPGTFKPTVQLALEGELVELVTLGKIAEYAAERHQPAAHYRTISQLEPTWNDFVGKFLKRRSPEDSPEDSRYPRYDDDNRAVVYLGTRHDSNHVVYPNWGIISAAFKDTFEAALVDPKRHRIANLSAEAKVIPKIIQGYVRLLGKS